MHFVNSHFVSGLKFQALILLPLFYFFLAFQAQNGRGASQNMDPDYIYLTNAYAVAQSHAPLYFDSPGTTVQLLGGAILALHRPAADELIQRPDYFYRLLSLSFNVMNVLAIFGLGVFFYLNGVPIFFAVAWQATFFLTMYKNFNAVRINPEAIGAGIMAIACLIYCSDMKRKVPVYAVLAAFATATKLYYLPLGVGILFLGSWKKTVPAVILYLICVLGVLVLYGEQFNAAFKYYLGIATHTGYGGTGSYGWPAWADILRWFKISTPTGYVLFVLPMVPVLLFNAFAMAKERRALIAGALVMEVLFFVAYLKYPFHRYYLIPAILLFPMAAFLLWREAYAQKRLPFSLLFCSLLVGLLALKVSHFGFYASKYKAEYASSISRKLKAIVSEHNQCDVLVYGAPIYKPMAFWFAALSDGGILRPELSRMFPNHYFTRAKDIFPFSGDPRTTANFFEDRRPGSCVVFISSQALEKFPSDRFPHLQGAKTLFASQHNDNFVYLWKKN